MKVVHNSLGETSIIDKATELEKQGEAEKAAILYNKIIRNDPYNIPAYTRLMIIYRKLKLYKKELDTIKTGIRSFEQLYKPSNPFEHNKKVKALSVALMRSTGLGDKKGNSFYQKEPIGTWTRRKLIVEKKLGNKK